jgi:hypothetical protein
VLLKDPYHHRASAAVWPETDPGMSGS